MKLMQIVFLSVLGITCVATYVTSETLNAPCEASAQMITPAPTDP